MSMADLVAQIKRILGKYERTMGIRIWGVDEEGKPVLVKVDKDGYLLIKST